MFWNGGTVKLSAKQALNIVSWPLADAHCFIGQSIIFTYCNHLALKCSDDANIWTCPINLFPVGPRP